MGYGTNYPPELQVSTLLSLGAPLSHRPPPRSCACGTRPHCAVCARVPNRPHASAGRASRCLASGPRGRRESDMELAREETLSPRPRIKRTPGGARHIVLPLRPGPRHYSRGSLSRSSRKRSARAPAGTCPRRIRTAISRRRSRFGLDIRPPGKPRTARPDRPTMTCVRALLPGFARAGSLARRDGGPRPAAPLSPPPMLFAIYALAQPPFSPRHLFPIYPVPRPPLFAVHLRRPSPPVSAPKPLVPDPFRSRAPPHRGSPAARSSLPSLAPGDRASVGRFGSSVPSLPFASLRYGSCRRRS